MVLVWVRRLMEEDEEEEEEEGSACPEGSEVFRNDAMSKLTFTSEANLDQCSDYTLHITPIFKEKSLDERIVPFRTLSQPVEDVALLLTSVEAEAGEHPRLDEVAGLRAQ